MTREAQLAALIMEFALKIRDLGVEYGLVVMDPTLQQQDLTQLHYSGSVSILGGVELFKTFLKMRENPQHEVRSVQMISREHEYVETEQGILPA